MAQVVHFLISNGFLLTSLELLVEVEHTQTHDGHLISQLLGPVFEDPASFPPDVVTGFAEDDCAQPLQI